MSSPPPEDDRTVIHPSGAQRGRSAAPDATAFPSTAVAGARPAGVAGGASNASSSAASSAGDSGNALPHGTYLGEFELTSVLGEGGFGIVYVAWDHSLQRRVALKEYMPAALAARSGEATVQVRSERHRETFEAGLKSFINEARLLAQFDHPSLVKVYRFWEANGTAYMVMPLYDGITLKDKLKQMSGPPDEAWLLGLLAPLTEALAVIHAENCFHRDIAPDNVILLAGSERPLLLDFGAARRVIGDMTQALTVILKPGYAPVEQYAELPEMKQGAWTDVYALAASVHFAIIGKTPPPSVGRLMVDNFVPLAQSAAGRYSDRFLQAIDKALIVRPAERTANIAALRADLGLAAPGSSEATQFNPPGSLHSPIPPTAMRPQPAPAPQAARATDAPPASGGNKGVLIGAGVAGLLAVSAAAFFLVGGQGKPAPAPTATAPTGAVPMSAPAPAPVTPAAAPTPSPATPRSFEITDEFRKVMAGQTANFKVDANAAKPSLRIGRDRLSFNVTSSRDGFVQVLLLGPDGSLLLLFPNAQSSDSRIKAGQTLKLPQASWPLDTAEPPGKQDFLVVVSAQPRDYSDLSTERDYIFLKLPTGQRGAELGAGWTRSTPLFLGGIKACPVADCEAYGAARFSVDIVH